jgi:4'-phosphopantetheinyl transferase
MWSTPSRHPALPLHTVHVWRASLDLPAEQAAAAHALLATDEQARAARLVYTQHRRHFSAARAILRLLLGRYLAVAPHRVQFAYDERGKPALAAQHTPDLHFNLAHSHGQALYAFAYQHRVGIDLEQIRADVASRDIAARFFTTREYAVLHKLPATEQHTAFFTCWTRKEACLKAQGAGLWRGLDTFDVLPLDSSGPVVLADATARDTCWLLTNLPLDRDYAAALAVEGKGWRLECWQADFTDALRKT